MRPRIPRLLRVPAVALLLTVTFGCDEAAEDTQMAEHELADAEASEEGEPAVQLASTDAPDDPPPAGVACQTSPDAGGTPAEHGRGLALGSSPGDADRPPGAEIVAYVPTEEDLAASLEYSARFANRDGTVRPMRPE